MKRRNLKIISLTLSVFSIITLHLSSNKKVYASDEERTIEEFNFDEKDPSVFYIADGWSNGGGFNCIWREKAVSYKDGIMSLKIDKDTEDPNYDYYAAGIMTNKFYQYGYYAVRMKSISNPGVISSFFTYAGPLAHEIDIEFIGNDPTAVEFNYFTDEVGNHEYRYRLNYDASKEFHEYSFLWEPNCITWFVDGEVAHKATVNIPVKPGQIMMNVWNAKDTAADWVGKYDGTTPLSAEYDWVRYTDKLADEDVNLDVLVDLKDLSDVASIYNKTSNDSDFKERYDVNRDGKIDIKDLVKVAKAIN